MTKRVLFLLVALAATSAALNAQKVALHSAGTVQHFEGTGALVAAYTASTAGDTIYLPGGAFDQPSTGFEKPLVIIGSGHYPDSTYAVGKTFLNGDFKLNEGSSGFYLEGVEVNGNICFQQDKSINNVTIKRCKFQYVYMNRGSSNTADSTYSNNINFTGNVATGALNLANGRNVLIANNIVVNGIRDTNGNQIMNNMFLNRMYTTSGNYTVLWGDNNFIANNVFPRNFSYYDYVLYGSGNRFYNNLFAHSNTERFGSTPMLDNNYFGVPRDSILINQTGESFDYSHDYHLQSPTTYLGNDGTQVGIYGGMFPYKEGAVPMNPHIQMHNIAPTASSGQLNVEIKAASQDD